MDVLPLASSLVQLQSARTASQVQYAVAARVLATGRQNGTGVVKLIEAAGRQMDAAAQAVVDASSSLDVYG